MATRFRFNLEAVLQQRRAVEEQQQQRLGVLERERLALEDRLRGLQRAIAGAKDDLRRRLGAEKAAAAAGRRSGVSLADVRMQANASLHLVARAQQTVLELAGVHRRLDAARLELLRATTERKAVELLKEKRFREWQEQNKRQEAAEIDEINVMRHGRNPPHQEAA